MSIGDASFLHPKFNTTNLRYFILNQFFMKEGENKIKLNMDPKPIHISELVGAAIYSFWGWISFAFSSHQWCEGESINDVVEQEWGAKH